MENKLIGMNATKDMNGSYVEYNEDCPVCKGVLNVTDGLAYCGNCNKKFIHNMFIGWHQEINNQ